MGHTYANLMYHCIFSTSHRKPDLSPPILERLVPFIGGIIREREGKLLEMNGPADHVHLLAIFPPKHSVSDMLRHIKGRSSAWIHDTFAESRESGWQEGYGAFSVSKPSQGCASLALG